jgi:hypothetical protein
VATRSKGGLALMNTGTEREKMIAGQLYRCADAELVARC